MFLLNKYDIFTFKDFIEPYTLKGETIEKVYELLRKSYEISIKQQDLAVEKRMPVLYDVSAKSALQREAMLNAMSLIEKICAERKV